MPEIEAKILEIDPADLQRRLLSIGARLSFQDEMHAVFFDHPLDSLPARGAVLRLRKEGNEVVLTYKSKVETSDPALKVLDEREVAIADFEEMRVLLRGLGYEETHQTRKLRVQYDLPGAHVVIDDYLEDLNHIPPFCEIEAEDGDRLYEVAEALGFAREQLCNWNSFELMEHYRGK
jgi:predicted adenylyl cyclase CyaB